VNVSVLRSAWRVVSYWVPIVLSSLCVPLAVVVSFVEISLQTDDALALWVARPFLRAVDRRRDMLRSDQESSRQIHARNNKGGDYRCP
jgi:hypothetical protein